MTKSPPHISVIIPCYNHGRYLPGAVASVVAQSMADWELIIVDDGSVDDTSAVARQLIATYPERAIRLIEQTNQGLSATRNKGIAAACGEYILPLDADDLIEPTMLAEASAVLDGAPEVGFVYTDVQMFGVEERIWSGGAYSLAKLRFDCPMMPMVLFRRTAWQQVGGFGANMWPQGYEDWDFWLALAASGWAGHHIAHPLVRYRRTNGSMLANVRRYDLELRAQMILNHPQIFPPAFVAWAQAVRAPGQIVDGGFRSRAVWWRAFAGYLWLVAIERPTLLPKTLLRPLFCRLPARQQGHARRLARALHLTQGR